MLIVGSRVANSLTYAFGFYTSFDFKCMVEDAISLVNRANSYIVDIFLTQSFIGVRIPTSALALGAARGLGHSFRNATFKFLSCIAS